MSVTITAKLHDFGPALVPELHPVEQLLEQRALDRDAFAALYQQDPLAESGGLFPDEYWRLHDDPLPPKIARAVLAVDSNFKEGVSSDFSAMAVWARTPDSHAWLEDLWQKQVGFTDLIAKIRELYAKWQHLRLTIHIEERANGHAALDHLGRRQAYESPDGTLGVHQPLPVRPWKPLGGWGTSKVARWEGVSPWQRMGKCHVRKGIPFLDTWLEQHKRLPRATHDDFGDTTTIALETLLGAPDMPLSLPNVAFKEAGLAATPKSTILRKTVRRLKDDGEDAIIEALKEAGVPF